MKINPEVAKTKTFRGLVKMLVGTALFVTSGFLGFLHLPVFNIPLLGLSISTGLTTIVGILCIPIELTTTLAIAGFILLVVGFLKIVHVI